MILPIFICMFEITQIHNIFQLTNFDLSFFFFSYLQQGTYPLTTPQNESFPQTYITNRHNLFKLIFNKTLINPLIQLNNPTIGTWFAMVKIQRLLLDIYRDYTAFPRSNDRTYPNNRRRSITYCDHKQESVQSWAKYSKKIRTCPPLNQ